MAKTWFPELWKPIEIDLEIPKDYYGPHETKSFYDPQDPRQAYEVRGVRPPFREVTNPERDAY